MLNSPARRGKGARETPTRRSFAVPTVGLGILLRSADMAFNRALREELAVHAVTFSQFQHLRHLWEEDGLTQAGLSRRIGIQVASSTSVLDSLERARLIRRVRQNTDRRKINVYLTPAGRELQAPLIACAARVNARARRDMSNKEMSLLFRNLKKVMANLNGHTP